MVSGQLRVIRYSPYCATAVAVTKELLKKVRHADTTYNMTHSTAALRIVARLLLSSTARCAWRGGFVHCSVCLPAAACTCISCHGVARMPCLWASPACQSSCPTFPPVLPVCKHSPMRARASSGIAGRLYACARSLCLLRVGGGRTRSRPCELRGGAAWPFASGHRDTTGASCTPHHNAAVHT